jgi:hypothetical protein
MDELFTMIISALVGGIVWLIFTVFLIPVIGGWINKAPSISGNWNYSDIKDGDVVGTAKISQTGNRVKVSATRTKDRDGGACNREFIYRGAVKGRDVVLNYEQKNAGGFVGGAMVLRLNASLNCMDGITAYFSDSAGEVIKHDIYYQK